MAGNFAALWPTDFKFLAIKDLNRIKKYTKNQEAASILRVIFALSKLPHITLSTGKRAVLIALHCTCLLWKWYNNSGNIEHSRKQLWFAFQELVVAGWLSNMPATHVYAYPIDFWLLCRHLCTALPSGGQCDFEPKISGIVKKYDIPVAWVKF